MKLCISVVFSLPLTTHPRTYSHNRVEFCKNVVDTNDRSNFEWTTLYHVERLVQKCSAIRS
jgi:hypothetical protein